LLGALVDANPRANHKWRNFALFEINKKKHYRVVSCSKKQAMRSQVWSGERERDK